MVKRYNRVLAEILIQWANLPVKMLHGSRIMQSKRSFQSLWLHNLEDKVAIKGGGMIHS